MKKRIFLAWVLTAIFFGAIGCADKPSSAPPSPTPPAVSDDQTNNGETNNGETAGGDENTGGDETDEPSDVWEIGEKEENDAVRPASYITDNIVLQRGKVNRLTGKTSGAHIAAALDDTVYYGRVTGDSFVVELPAQTAGDGHTLTLYTDGGKKTLQNVAVGEVFLCAGQSNMVWTLNASSSYYKDLVATADYPDIRLFNIPKTESPTPCEFVEGVAWQKADSATLGGFSAVGFLTGQRLQQSLDVPVGLVSAAVGSSLLCYWLPEETFAALDKNGQVYKNPDGATVFTPCLGYNGMLAPVLDMTLGCVLWYQGESNGYRHELYEGELTALITAWRAAFGDPALGFSVVELPRYNEAQAERYAGIREAQYAVSRALPNVALSVNIDDGDSTDIHPRFKTKLAERLARATLAAFYDGAPYYTPVAVKAERIALDTSVVTVEGGFGDLVLKNGANGFEVGGMGSMYSSDGITVWVEGNRITVTADRAFSRIRYGYLSAFAGETDVSKFVTVYDSADNPLRQFVSAVG